MSKPKKEYEYGRAHAIDSVTGEELVGFKIPKLGGRIPQEALIAMQRPQPQVGVVIAKLRKQIKKARQMLALAKLREGLPESVEVKLTEQE